MNTSRFEHQLQLAVQHFTAGRLDQAWAVARRLLELAPQHAGILQLLGEIAWIRGNNREAETLFERAVSTSPGDPHAHFRLANALFSRRQVDAAEKHYRRSLTIKPDYWQSAANLGLLLRARGEYRQAIDCFELVLQQRPGHTVVYCYRLDLLLALGEFTKIKESAPQLHALIHKCIEDDTERDFAALMYLAPLLSVSRQEYDDLSAKMDRLLRKPGDVALFKAQPSAGEKIRIGYLSPDFGDHPVSHVMLGLFGQHDRDRFGIIAYSIGNRTGSADRLYTDRIRQSCDDFVDLTALVPRQAAERIAADGISILVNLAGYMSPPGLEILSWRPAPVQVYWLGHGGGLGLSFVDYVIADRIVVPPGEESHYRERIARLPDCYHCADTPAISDAPQRRTQYGLSEQAFVFCAFNNPNKIDGEVFDVWMNILRRVPDSQLWLSGHASGADLERNLRNEASRRDVDPDRLVFASRVPDKSVHFARHRLADLFLDTFVYNASTTAIDALWSGLPVLTCAGDDFYSRICASHVSNAGLADMVCRTAHEYEERAVFYAGNPGELAAIHARLAGNIRTGPLFDLPRFARNLERAYQRMWQHHLAGAGPQCIDLAGSP